MDAHERPSPIAEAEATPLPSGDPEDLAALLDDIHAYYERYIVFSLPSQAVALALWTLYTHCDPASQPYSECPYVLVTSAEPMSGKSTLLELAAAVVHDPLDAQDVTPATVGRTVAGMTLILDEIDGIYNNHSDEANSSKAGDMRTILNAGFKKNGTYIRLVRDSGKDYEKKSWSVFGPKMLAGIGRKVPDTVQTRSIRLRLSRKTNDAPAQKARSRTVQAEAEPLKARMRIAAALLGELPYVTDIARHLGARDLDLWEPLFAIARTASPEWEAKAEAAAVELAAAEPVLSIGMQLLRDIRDLFNDNDNPPFIATKSLIGDVADVFNRQEGSGLCGNEEAPWATFNRGRPITAKQVAGLLGEYDIKSDREHVGRNAYGPTGYFRNAFAKSWDAYLESPEEPATVVIPLFPVVPADSADSEDRQELRIHMGLVQ